MSANAGELPTMSNTSLSYTTASPADLTGVWESDGTLDRFEAERELWPNTRAARRVPSHSDNTLLGNPIFPVTETFEEDMTDKEPTRRIVKVFIVDPDERVPLDKSLLHSSDELFTDLNNQELFYDLDIKDILTKHNEERVKIKDPDSEKEEFLKPIRIRDLMMTVVTIAEF